MNRSRLFLCRYESESLRNHLVSGWTTTQKDVGSWSSDVFFIMYESCNTQSALSEF
jgi:hypothetical protein